MASYWWKCESCGKEFDFNEVTGSRGIAHFIWDELLNNEWNQSLLIRKCLNCGNNGLRITYEFPGKDKVELTVVHIIGIRPFNGKYISMMWETIPSSDRIQRWFDFKYINGRSVWGLNKAAVFTIADLKEILNKYEKLTGNPLFS